MHANIFEVTVRKPDGSVIEMNVRREGLTPWGACEIMLSKLRKREREAIMEGEWTIEIKGDKYNVLP